MSESQSFKDLIESTATPTKQKDKEEKLPQVISEALDNTIPHGVAPTELERKILGLLLQGTPLSQIAFNTGLPEAHIRNYVRNPKVKEYLKELKEAMNEIDQLMLVNTMRQMVGDRIEELDEDDSYASLSRKDTLDIIKVFSDMTNQIAKSTKEEKSNDVFVNIYQQILEN